MPSIVESVSAEAGTPDAVSALQRVAPGDAKVGTSDVEWSAAVVLAALADATRSEGGKEAVAGLITATGVDQLAELPDSLGVSRMSDDELIDALLGSKRQKAVNRLKNKGSLGGEAYDALLPAIAPVVLGVIARQQAEDGLAPDALAELLISETNELRFAGSGDVVGAYQKDAADIAAIEARGAPAEAPREIEDDDEGGSADAVAGSSNADIDTVEAPVAPLHPNSAVDASGEADGSGEGDDNAEAADENDEAQGQQGEHEVAAVAAATTTTTADSSLGAGSEPAPPGEPSHGQEADDESRRRSVGVLVPLAAIVAAALGVAWLVSTLGSDTEATDAGGGLESAQEPAGPSADPGDGDPEGPTEAAAVNARSGAADDDDSSDDSMDDDATDDEQDAAAAAGDDESDGADEVEAPEADSDAGEDADDEPGAAADGDAAAADDSDADDSAGEDAADGDDAAADGDAADGDAADGDDAAAGGADQDAAGDDDAADDDAGRITTTDEDGHDSGDDSSSGTASLNEVLDLAPITFDYYDNGLSAQGRAQLDAVVEYLDGNDGDVEIRGHTDAIGDATLNVRLGLRRAEAVKAYLVNAGIDPERLFAVGVGEVEPVESNDTESGRAANRRIELLAN